jgi:hypothetical protein
LQSTFPPACWRRRGDAGAVINAAHTVTFIALKPGLLTGKARDVTGRLHVNALGLDDWLAGRTRRCNVLMLNSLRTG